MARQARNLCAGKAVLLINDRPDVARIAEVDGVHLGQDDLPCAAARKPPRTGRPDRRQHPLRRGDRGGAIRDYIGFGPSSRPPEAGSTLPGSRTGSRGCGEPCSIRGSPSWPSAASPPRPSRAVAEAGARCASAIAYLCNAETRRAARDFARGVRAMRPVIGITPDVGESSARPGRPALPRYELKRAYADAVLAAGGLPIVLPYSDDPAAAEEALNICAGLVITGGAFDIPPEAYGKKAGARLGPLKRGRTAYEQRVLRAALATGMPVLGICGGMQLLAVELGGTLHQDIAAEVPGALDHEQKNDPREPGHTASVYRGLRARGDRRPRLFGSELDAPPGGEGSGVARRSPRWHPTASSKRSSCRERLLSASSGIPSCSLRPRTSPSTARWSIGRADDRALRAGAGRPRSERRRRPARGCGGDPRDGRDSALRRDGAHGADPTRAAALPGRRRDARRRLRPRAARGGERPRDQDWDGRQRGERASHPRAASRGSSRRRRPGARGIERSTAVRWAGPRAPRAGERSHPDT